MRIIYSDKHQLHDTAHLLYDGRPFATAEVPARAEAILSAVQAAGLGQSLDGDDVRSVGARRRNHAGHHRRAVEEDRARAAFPLGAAFLRPDQMTLIAQQAQQRQILPRGKPIRAAVDRRLRRRDRCPGNQSF